MSRAAIDIDGLNDEEKLELIESLWNSLSSNPSNIPLTEAQKKMLDERIAAMDAGDLETIPWQEVRARITKNLS